MNSVEFRLHVICLLILWDRSLVTCWTLSGPRIDSMCRLALPIERHPTSPDDYIPSPPGSTGCKSRLGGRHWMEAERWISSPVTSHRNRFSWDICLHFELVSAATAFDPCSFVRCTTTRAVPVCFPKPLWSWNWWSGQASSKSFPREASVTEWIVKRSIVFINIPFGNIHMRLEDHFGMDAIPFVHRVIRVRRLDPLTYSFFVGGG